MKSRSIRHVPVLNVHGKLVGIHFLEELIGTSVKPNIAVIMAGGKGPASRPLTANVRNRCSRCGKADSERIILHLVGYGIREIYLSINYLGNMIEPAFREMESAFGCSIKYLREREASWTREGLSSSARTVESSFDVMNPATRSPQVDIAKLFSKFQ